jgi:hypothetical protein
MKMRLKISSDEAVKNFAVRRPTIGGQVSKFLAGKSKRLLLARFVG